MTVFSQIFNTNCSLPTTPYHYVTSANIRSTTDILWSSATALVLFTWAIQHLNVPYQKESKTQKQQIRNFFDEMLLKASFMIGTIIAPELLLGKALGDLMSARESRDQMKTYAEKDKVEWSLTHAFYANMGGFVIQFSPGTRVPTQVDRLQGTTETTTTDHGHNALSLDSPELVIHESSDSIPKKEQVHESPVDIERGSPPRKRKVDISKPHKLISGEDCPCSDQKNDSEYKYMTIEDISVHFAKPWYLFGFNPFPIKFWNGRFLVDPGPFKEILKHPNEEAGAIADTTNDRNASDILYELAHRPETDKNLFDDVQNGLSRLRGRYWALDARQLYKARELGIIESLPSVSEEAIQDQSKGDAVIKLTAMFQAFYLVLQLIVRRIEGLPSSLLEIMVVAFSACAFITYLLFFPKPQGVKVPRYIHAARYPTPEEIGIIAKPAPFDCMIGYRKRTYAMPNLTMHYWWGNKKSIFEFIADESSHGGLLLLMVGSVFGGMVFGAIHCAGWYSDFPTPLEGIFWRVSSLCTIFGWGIWTLFFLPFLLFIHPVFVVYDIIKRCIAKRRRKPEPQLQAQAQPKRTLSVTVMRVLGLKDYGKFTITVSFHIWLSGTVYILARLYMMCEVIRQLFFLPPGAFQTTSWLVSIPHGG